MKKLFLLLTAYCLLIIVPCLLSPVRASYVLPYPSYMPGNKLYGVSRMFDAIKQYWYFGSIARVKYHLGLSDKYLVEAKTLFEYKQYLLGVDGLHRSTKQFQALTTYVKRGVAEGKDMTSIVTSISESAAIHEAVLGAMKTLYPEILRWVPEKEAATDLRLHNEFDNAISTIAAVVEELKR